MTFASHHTPVVRSPRCACLTLAACLMSMLLLATPAGAERVDDTAIVAIDLETLDYTVNPRWPGVRTAVLTGQPSQPGLYTTHAWMREGTIVPVHTHPDPRITVVTHGTMYVGVGSTYDESSLVAYPTGSVFITPAGSPHFMLAKDGDTAVLDSGAGPTGIDVLE